MTRLRKSTAALIALAALGFGAAPTLAGGLHHGHRHGNYSTIGTSCGQRVAGYITIAGCRTKITAGRGMLAQIARAFRKKGYRAWIHDGCLSVDYGCYRPEVRWKAFDYSTRIKWGWDEMTLSLRRAYRTSSYDYPQRRYRPIRRSYRNWYCD